MQERDFHGGDTAGAASDASDAAAAAATSPPLLLLNSCTLAAFHPTSQSLSALAAGSSFAGFVFNRKESRPPDLSIALSAVVVTGRRTCLPAAESQRDFC